MVAAFVAVLALPGGLFGSVQPAGGELLVSGSTTGNTCISVTVAPASFRQTGELRGSCARPRRSAYPVVPVMIPDPRSQRQSVRIAHVGTSTTYGPVVMRFEDGSDTRPVYAYGPGSLWLYDVDTERGSELLRFSSSTGRLLQTVVMPRLFRPVIAADDVGLYLIAAVNGGVSGPAPAALYYVAPGARHAVVIHREGRAALWITAHGTTVWTEIVSGTGDASLWRFDGRRGRLLWRGRIGPAPVAIFGAGTLWAVTPVWAARYSGDCTRVKVSQIDAITGRQKTIATIPASGYCSLLLDPQGLTYFKGAFYFLDGSRLYRVRT